MKKKAIAPCREKKPFPSEPVGKKSLVRNIIFAMPAAFLVFQGRENQGLSLSQLSNEMALQLGFGVIITYSLIGVAFWLKKILEQQTQIIKRLDLMELIVNPAGAARSLLPDTMGEFEEVEDIDRSVR